MQISEILQPLDDVDCAAGLCEWSEVANARDEIRRRLEAALSAAEPVDASSVSAKAWTQKDMEREYLAFKQWFKEQGYPKFPQEYPFIAENAMHAAWQMSAERSALSAQVQDVAESPATKAIAAERERQIEVEGWTPEHDDAHTKGELLLAAKAYFAHATDRALSLPDGERAGIPFVWPWDKKWWKPKTPRKDLIRAGALALAEIERIKRLYHVRAEHRYIDAEAHYRLIVAELERLDSAAAPAKQEGGHD